MASLLAGFEYDIFISYRHNDNRSGWVTEFVHALQEELAATIKTPVSIYFDTNPHDGLLETHNVDKSLENKLKCLILIPILSQTYCDKKSFAWQHEFIAFHNLAKLDQIGLNVTLGNSNVASRILPVKIHTLDEEDKILFETEIGGALRAIEFIYREAGVNRPLKSSDLKHDNQNKTEYRNQVNKVANAIKEIMASITSPVAQASKTAPRNLNIIPQKRSQKTLRVIIASVALLIVSGFCYYSFIYNNAKGGSTPDKSIAVLSFKNISPNSSDDYFSDGMTEEIINYLTKVSELKVMSRTSIEQYKRQTKDPRAIAAELGVSYILDGSVRKAGNTFRISVQLIQAETGFQLWSNEYDKEISDVLRVQSDISQEVTDALKVVLTDSEKKNIAIAGPVQLSAYDFYLKARSELMSYRNARFSEGRQHIENAIALFNRSLKADPKFARAYSGLGLSYSYKGDDQVYIKEDLLDSARRLADKALELDENIDEAYYLKALYSSSAGKNDEAISDLEKALRINPNYADAMMSLGLIYNHLKQDYVTGLSYMQHSIRLGRGPELASNLRLIGSAYYWVGLYDKCKESYGSAQQLDGDSSYLYWIRAEILRFNHQYEQALTLENNALRLNPANPFYNDEKSWLLSLLGRNREALDARLSWEKTHINSSTISEHRIGYLYWVLGDKAKGKEYFHRMIISSEASIRLNRTNAQQKFAQYDLAGVYAFLGQKEKAYSYLREVSSQKFIPVWLSNLAEEDPLFNKIRNEVMFMQIAGEIKKKGIAERNRVMKSAN